MTQPDFWRGKRVFLTGHTGFKGAWMTLVLRQFGAQVKGFSLSPPTSPNLFEAAKVAQGIEHEVGDIRNFETLKNSILSFAPDIVIHMAAQALVRDSYTNPLETFSTNVMGTAHLLESLRAAPSVKSAVIVTTDKCYENREWLWPYREDEPMGGKDPYSSSKACTELVAASYRFSFFQKNEKVGAPSASIATARAGNVIGGGDWAKDRLVPDMIRAFTETESVKIRAPHSVRPWQHVLEPISGYLLLAERMFTEGQKYEGAWNFGPNESDARKVSYLADQVVQSWGKPATWELDKIQHPHEASMLKLDISKAKYHLNWQPRWNIDKCIELTCQWYKEFYSNPEGANRLCLAQIDSYFSEQ